MSEITILNNMAERAVDHWVPGELYRVKATYNRRLYESRWEEELRTSGNCLLGLVGYAVWGDAYNTYIADHDARGPLKSFLKSHKIKADCIDGYELLEQDPDALAVIHRLAELIRAQGPVLDDEGEVLWEWDDIESDQQVVYNYNDALGKDKVIELIDKARADVGALGEQ